MKKRQILMLFIITVLCFNFQSCTSSSSQESKSKKAINSDLEKAPVESKISDVENKDKSGISGNSIEDDILFIRDKYKVITNTNDSKIETFNIECSGGSTKLERKFNKLNQIEYLQYEICSDHGCLTKHHYFWEGKLIFIFSQDSYWVGNTDTFKEHRTYFKNEQMIRCLEKEVTTTNGQPKIEDVIKTTPNKKVNCNPSKLTEDLSKLKTMNKAEAEKYFCE